LFAGFSTSANVQAAEWRADISKYDLGDAREEIALRTIQSYLDVYRNRQVAQMSQANVDMHIKTLQTVQDRVDGGQADTGDLNQAKSRLSLAKARLRQTQGDLRESEVNFQEVVGTPADELMMANGNLLDVNLNEEQAVERAFDNNPQINAAKASEQARQADVDVAQANFYPSVDFKLSEGRDWDVSGVEGATIDRRAVISLDYNLYSGGADRARYRRALELSSEARQKEAETRRDVERQMRNAYNDYETAFERLAFLQERVAASQAVVKSYREQYAIGGRTLLDVLDVENEFFQSKVAYADGDLSYKFAQYRVLAIMGELVNRFGSN